VISLPQRPQLENTEHLHETDIHARVGIRTPSPTKLAATGIGNDNVTVVFYCVLNIHTSNHYNCISYIPFIPFALTLIST